MKKFRKLQKSPKLNLENVRKFWEREYSIFTVSSWRLSFDIINSKQWVKDAFSIFICFHHNEMTTHFRSQAEERRFEMSIGEKIAGNTRIQKKIIRSHGLFAKHLIRLFKQIETAKTFNSKFIRDFNLSFGRFVAFNTFVQRAVDYLSKFKQHQRIVSLLIQRRTRYEHVVASYDGYLKKMCEKIAKEKGIKSVHLLTFLVLEEFINFLRTGNLPKDIKERTRISATIILPRPALLVGEAAGNLFKKLKYQEERSTQQLLKGAVLRGTPVFSKKIRGYVQVISSLKQLSKFKKNYILVAPSTSPKYNPALKRAAGIITDEGGLLCHAAIISREFKIPGVVGTRVATKKLKTGQIVELDAINGIVKILK